MSGVSSDVSTVGELIVRKGTKSSVPCSSLDSSSRRPRVGPSGSRRPLRVSGMTTKAKFEGHQQHEEEENRVLRAQPEGGHVKQEVDRFGTTKEEEEEDPPCPF